mmetsp:Transcript_6273/g.12091  ORF Transcript_6273/g.12091 Transcript_6273/m.12091 type:complete len:445 (-) Transcript_6273:314-1648(-)
MSDDDFDYSRDEGVSAELGGDDFMGPTKARVVQNQPHDEEVALSDTESFGADEPPNVPGDASLIESHDIDDVPAAAPAPVRSTSPPRFDSTPVNTATPSASTLLPAATAGAASTPDDGSGSVPLYNAQDYRHLNVTDEIRDLFQLIGRYRPQVIEIETKLKPFIPDYIPAVGGIDEFIKVPRPDGKPDFLGLKVLDEPAAKQSDPTVLALQLRQVSKDAPGRIGARDIVGRIEHRDESKAKRIQQWISSIGDIHKAKPPANVVYSRRMPELESLMQEWNPELELGLRNAAAAAAATAGGTGGGSGINISGNTGNSNNIIINNNNSNNNNPSNSNSNGSSNSNNNSNGGVILPADLEVDLATYTKMVCGLLDIPVYQNPVESLHVLFSLYLDFKSNPIFRQHLDLEDKANALLQGGDVEGIGGGYGSFSVGMGDDGGGINIFSTS